MTAFLQQYISPALPVILWLGRALVSGLAVWLLVRCCLSLFRGKDRESWGFVTLSNGARYEIYHWENVIGRAKRSDIRINFPSVSRSHAILSRDEAGTWRVNPLNHSSGVLLNGQRTLTTADLHPGDSIAVGGVELFFFPSDKPQPSGQPRRRPGPVGGLWLLTFIQLLLWAQFAPNFGAENIYPISAGFFGLCGLGWVLYAVSRKLHRRQFDLETLALLLTTVGFAITAAWDPGALYKQLAAVTLGMGIYGTLVWLLGRLHLAVKLRWPVAAAAAALLAFNVVMGERIFGAKNWISVGPISFQPSELAKFSLMIWTADMLDRDYDKKNRLWYGAIKPALPLLPILYLLHKEPHNSAMILLCLIFATMLICTLSPGHWLLPLIPACAVAGSYFLKGLASGEGYAAGRMDAAWGLAPLDTAGMGWQTLQSIYAISTGGMFGVGIGASVQKHQWLPYAENDFIFGVIGEELGFFGCVILIGAFAVLLIMGIMIALRAPDLYGTVLGIGIISQIAWQVFLHIAVGTALIPNTGISLPFFSSGGTSLLLLLSEMGVLLSISRAGNAREQRLAEQHRAETERMLQRTRYRSRAAR